MKQIIALLTILLTFGVPAQVKNQSGDSSLIAVVIPSVERILEEQGGLKCRLYGTVVDESTREPIAKAKIFLLGTQFSAVTSSDGQYRIESVPEGIYQVKAEAAGYEPKTISNYSLEEKSTKSGPLFFMKKKDQPPADFVEVDRQPAPKEGGMVQPLYPESARKLGVQGTVWLKVWIDAEGVPQKTEVIKSDVRGADRAGVDAGGDRPKEDVIKSVSEEFDQASIDAAMKWRFTPAVLKGKPVAVWVTIPFKFKLSGNSEAKEIKKNK